MIVIAMAQTRMARALVVAGVHAVAGAVGIDAPFAGATGRAAGAMYGGGVSAPCGAAGQGKVGGIGDTATGGCGTIGGGISADGEGNGGGVMRESVRGAHGVAEFEGNGGGAISDAGYGGGVIGAASEPGTMMAFEHVGQGRESPAISSGASSGC
jgi:hypothetical protein